VRNHPEGPGRGMGEKDEGERSVENAACWTGGRASSSPTALAISLFVLRRNLCLFRRGLVLFIVLVDVGRPFCERQF
jgi:pSer/pThr/pTyr-binding forkhead associated (FHA) protein